MITPGVVFSPGQLVTADMLNNLVSNSEVQDNAIKSTNLKDTFIDDFSPVSEFGDLDKILIFDQVTNSTRSITTQDFFNSATKDVNAVDVTATGDMGVTGNLNVGGDTELRGTFTSGTSSSSKPGFYVETNDYLAKLEATPVRQSWQTTTGDQVAEQTGLLYMKYNLPDSKFGHLKLGTASTKYSYLHWCNELNHLDVDGYAHIQNYPIDKGQPINTQNGGLYFATTGDLDKTLFEFRGEVISRGGDTGSLLRVVNEDYEGVNLLHEKGATTNNSFLYPSKINSTGNFRLFIGGNSQHEWDNVFIASPLVGQASEASTGGFDFRCNLDSPDESAFAFYHDARTSSSKDIFTLYRATYRAGSESVFRVGSTINEQNIRTEFYDRVRFAKFTTTEISNLTGGAGDVVFNETTAKLQVYNGASWVDLH